MKHLVFSRDGRRIASAADDGTVRVWEADLQTGLPILRGHTSYIYPVAFSPDGRWIASGSWDNTVRLWDALTGETSAVLRHPARISFSPDGATLVSGSGDGTLRLWDTAPIKTRYRAATPLGRAATP